tara:strand:+ start:6029 stop:8149 length:2121 start_codon:yes stop_codon:yes gene_type:complete
MAEKVALKIDIDAKGAATSLGQLEEEAERLNEELRKVPLGSKAFKDLKSELISVNKEIKNTELSMESLDNEQVASELGSVAGAVGDVSAAFILLGGGGGPIEETVQNIEKAIGVSMAFKGAIEGTQSMMKLLNNSTLANTIITKANTAATYLANTAMKLLGITVKGTSRSFKVLKGAIISSGIGVLVAVLGEVVSMTMDWLDGSDELEKELADLTETLKKYRAEITSLNNEIDIATQKELLNARIRKANAKELRGIETKALKDKLYNFKVEEIKLKQLLNKNKDNEEKVALIKEQLDEATINRVAANNRLELKLLDNKLQTTIEVDKEISDAQAKTDAANAKKLEEQKKRNLEEQKAAFDLLIAQKEINAKSLQDFIDLENFKLNHLKKASNLTKSQRELAEFNTQQSILKITKEFQEKEAALKKGYQNDLNKDLLEELEIKKDIQDIEIEDEDPIFETDFLNKTAEATKEKTRIKIEGVKDEIEQEKQLKLQQLTWDEEQVIQKAILDGTYADQKLFIEKDFQRQRQEVIEAADRKILENQKAVEAAKIDLAVQGIGSLINLTTAFAKDNEKSQRKAFEINKKLQIAQAIMSTYQGANAIFSAAALNPASILFPAQPFIAAGIAIVNGLANVASISKQQFQTSSPGGGGQQTPSFGGGGGGTPPTLQPANTSTLVSPNQTQVFVTEADITSTQSSVAVIQGQATF